MKKTTLALLALTALLVALPALAGEAPATETLTGEFVWERKDGNHSDEIKAVFEPTGENTWNVAFHFVFQGEDHVYAGTAEGSLDGDLSGEVMSDGDQPNPYTFEGSFENGVFTGTHAYLDGDEAKPTGTITLSRG